MAALAFALLPLLAGCGHTEPPRKILTPVNVTVAGRVRPGEAGDLRYTGSVAADTQVDLAFKEGGNVVSILRVPDGSGGTRLVQAGDTVRAGAVLAQVRQSDYTARVAQAQAQRAQSAAGIAQAQGGLAQARATEAQATGRLLEAQAGREAALTQWNEAQAGRKQAQQQIEAARIAQQGAAQQVEEAQAAVRQAQAGVEEARAGAERARQDFERAEALYKAESLTKTDYDAARANDAAMQAKLQQATQQVQGAQARVAQAQAQVQGADNRTEQAQTQLSVAESRVAEAQAQIGARTAQVSQARAGQAQARAAVQSAQAQVEGAQAAQSGAGAQVTAAQLTQGDTALRAPIDGVVLDRRVEIGTLVGQGTPGFSVARVDRMKVLFGAPEVAARNLKMGQAIPVTVDSLSQRSLQGRITAISPAADARTRVFSVEVTVPNPQRQLKVGMIATLLLPGQRETGGALIPLAALVHSTVRADGYAVVVVAQQEGKTVAHWRDVEVGNVSGNRMAVGGIKPGEQVITTGAPLLHEGEEVQVISRAEEAADGAQD